jgi:hypothetical protein
MPSDFLTILSDDDETHDALVRAFDERFPPNALTSYLIVQKASEKHSAGQLAKRERIATLQAKKRDWQHHVTSFDRDVARGAEYPPSEVKKRNASKKKSEQADAEINSLRNEQQTPNLPDETLAEFVMDSHGKFVAVAVEAKLPKGQTPLEALQASRANREALVRKKADTNREPLPLADSVARLKADVYAKGQGPDVGAIMKMKPEIPEHFVAKSTIKRPDMQGHLEWPTMGEFVEGGRRIEIDQGNALVCWLFPAAIIERGTAELTKLYAGRKGLSVADRNRVLAEIDAEILMEERREEMAVRMCEDAGVIVFRRPLANPLAVLGIEPA